MKPFNNKASSVNIIGSLLFLFLVLVSLFWQCSSSKDAISYNDHIRPIFNKKCLSCHGGVRQLGDFSLLFENEAFAATRSGNKAIVKGSPGGSELYKRITHHDPEQRMPKDAPPLSDSEKELIAEWIDQGAEWEDHWAYLAPVSNGLPDVDSKWVSEDLDYFIYKKFTELDLTPSKEADKDILIRRLSLDLTGLPPDIPMVDSYKNDNSENAYENLVDQLLASPHFGERWAAMWLDLARYADSRGYEKDAHRNIWRYRDWVIDAFNRDLPFDEFTIEQLAGDLLANPTKDQLIATAFNRNTMTNDEGGTEDEEFRIAAVVDRINTTFETWQSTTISCVQCHSHPYDPIKHEEFYEVMDIFNQTADRDLDTEAPHLFSFGPEDEAQIQEIVKFIKELEPTLHINEEALGSHQIKQAIFPKLLPGDCDASIHAVFNGEGSIISNWAQPSQSVSEKDFYFLFTDIDLSGLSDISFEYHANGDQSRIEVRLDAIDGPLLCEYDFPLSEGGRWDRSKFASVKVPVKNREGKHDLFFEIINKTGDIAEGMLSIGLMELHYEDKYETNSELQGYQNELLELRTKADKTPITQPIHPKFGRKTNVFERGNFATLGDEVSASVPNSFIANSDQEEPANRLDFAKWLVSEDNPLTARVIVNRFWEQIFGTGIIESLEDFGTQSLPASHPELLDHMALRFMNEHEWSVKSLLKEIVMSATYRQSSKVIGDKLEKDPYNRLLSRGTRFRLSAEQIRDQALAVSGLINDSIGGSSVMPPQPEGVWAVVYNNHQWITPKDDLKFRRGLYTYWKRTAPYPSLMTFDSPSREVCVSRRIRTNTPLQALVTLNDPVYLEAAEALGALMEDQGKGDLKLAIRYGYKKAMVSEPDEETIEILTNLYMGAEQSISVQGLTVANTENDYSYDATIKNPMTVVANAIMNLDGFLMKE